MDILQEVFEAEERSEMARLHAAVCRVLTPAQIARLPADPPIALTWLEGHADGLTLDSIQAGQVRSILTQAWLYHESIRRSFEASHMPSSHDEPVSELR